MMKTLYRCFDKTGDLLYIGVTKNIDRRMQQHKVESHWFHLVERVDCGPQCQSEDAHAAERHAILTEKPRCNLMCSTSTDHDFLDVAKISSAINSGAKLDINSSQGQEILMFVRRIEGIRSAPDSSRILEREVFEEARAAGYMTRALRSVLKQRSKIKSDNLFSASGFEAYRAAVGLM